MNILLTGSEGYIGKYLQDRLEGNITGIDRKTGGEVMNITERDLDGIDTVIHLAAQTSVWNADHMQIIEDNILAFTHLFFLCRQLNKGFVFASSSCAANATSLYGISKRYDELLSTTYDFGIGLRFHNVYGGPGREDTLYGICMNNNAVSLWNNGENARHFTHIDDICKGIQLALTLKNGLYNICNPETNTTLDFAREIQKYKPLDISLVNERRELDREGQIVEELPNILEKYVGIGEGIRRSFPNAR